MIIHPMPYFYIGLSGIVELSRFRGKLGNVMLNWFKTYSDHRLLSASVNIRGIKSSMHVRVLDPDLYTSCENKLIWSIQKNIVTALLLYLVTYIYIKSVCSWSLTIVFCNVVFSPLNMLEINSCAHWLYSEVRFPRLPSKLEKCKLIDELQWL